MLHMQANGNGSSGGMRASSSADFKQHAFAAGVQKSALSDSLSWRLDSHGKAVSPDTIKKRGLKVTSATLCASQSLHTVARMHLCQASSLLRIQYTV